MGPDEALRCMNFVQVLIGYLGQRMILEHAIDMSMLISNSGRAPAECALAAVSVAAVYKALVLTGVPWGKAHNLTCFLYERAERGHGTEPALERETLDAAAEIFAALRPMLGRYDAYNLARAYGPHGNGLANALDAAVAVKKVRGSSNLDATAEIAAALKPLLGPDNAWELAHVCGLCKIGLANALETAAAVKEMRIDPSKPMCRA